MTEHPNSGILRGPLTLWKLLPALHLDLDSPYPPLCHPYPKIHGLFRQCLCHLSFQYFDQHLLVRWLRRLGRAGSGHP